MTDEDRRQPVVLSRYELYSQIWATPMIRLAAQYGISASDSARSECRRRFRRRAQAPIGYHFRY
jgi:hypothetical protein